MNTTDELTYRIQAAGSDASDLAVALRIAATGLDSGYTSGYLADTYHYEPAAPAASDAAELFDNSPWSVVVEITDTTYERVAFTTNLIADQIDDGLMAGADSDDEGLYSFIVKRRGH